MSFRLRCGSHTFILSLYLFYFLLSIALHGSGVDFVGIHHIHHIH